MALRQEILHWGQQQLANARIADSQTDSWLLYEAVTGMDRMHFLMKNREEMPQQEIQQYEDVIQRRCQHVPLQYITGNQDFMGMTFRVNENVLIPRFDTEILVLEAEKFLSDKKRVLDMCTGSGCIAVSLKKRNPQLEVTAVDCSEAALEIARENGRLLKADVCFCQSDLFEMFKQTEQLKNNKQLQQQVQFDVIVSNPPYIPTEVIRGLDEEVRCHEPMMALDGTEDGLEFYRRITRESKTFLAEEGMLFYEIGHNQASAVSAIMETEGFTKIQVIKDLAGLDRVVYGGMKHV